VDGQTAAEYETNLEANLRTLLDRAKSGEHYRAPPVRRVNIPKGNTGKTRPIGIPCFEDKVLQRAVSMVLEAVYEQDFLDCSYGFRPGRGCGHLTRFADDFAEFRPAGSNALLGSVHSRRTGGEAKDDEIPLSARATPHHNVVSAAPALDSEGAKRSSQ
jgi:hypothetical protein